MNEQELLELLRGYMIEGEGLSTEGLAWLMAFVYTSPSILARAYLNDHVHEDRLWAAAWASRADRPRTFFGVPSPGQKAPEIPLQGVCLKGEDLQGLRLSGANLHKANLRGINLSGARLVGSSLIKADLQGANLQGADLGGVFIHKTSLRDANLQGANLEDAHFTEVDLTGADLQGAALHGARFWDVDVFGANFSNAPTPGVKWTRTNVNQAYWWGPVDVGQPPWVPPDAQALAVSPALRWWP